MQRLGECYPLGMPFRTSLLAALGLAATAFAQTPGAWVPVSPTGPSPILGQRMCFDGAQGRVLLMQMAGTGGVMHSYDGAQWTVVSTNILGSNSLEGFAYDPVRDLVLYSNYVGTFRKWDGATWQPAGGMPFTNRSHDLCWDSARQRVVTLQDAGIWEWDGQSWALLPGSALPVALNQVFPGPQLAFDSARGVLVVSARTVTGTRTFEWDGVAWIDHGLWPVIKPLYAPSMGGTIGIRPNSADTLIWNASTGAWELAGFGGSPGFLQSISHLAWTYDEARARPVAMLNTTGHTLWEYDSSAIPQRTTWTVDQSGAGDFVLMGEAVAAASAGDRIVVRPGSYTFWNGGIDKGLQIDCDPGVIFPDLDVDPDPAWGADRQLVSIRGAETGRVQFFSGQLRMSGCSVQYAVAAFGSDDYSLHLQDCVITGATYQATNEPALYCGGRSSTGTALIDGCSITGPNGFWLNPFDYEYGAQAAAFQGNCRVVILDSSLTGGDNPGVGASGEPALWTSSSIDPHVSGASQLTAGAGGGSAVVGTITHTPDVVAQPPLGPSSIPAMSWLDAPLTVGLGQTMTVQANLQPGHTVLLAFGDSTSPVVVPGIRIPLALDATGPVVGVATMNAASSQFDLTIPNQLGLIGLETYWQGIAVGPQSFELTNYRSILIE